MSCRCLVLHGGSRNSKCMSCNMAIARRLPCCCVSVQGSFGCSYPVGVQDRAPASGLHRLLGRTWSRSTAAVQEQRRFSPWQCVLRDHQVMLYLDLHLLTGKPSSCSCERQFACMPWCVEWFTYWHLRCCLVMQELGELCAHHVCTVLQAVQHCCNCDTVFTGSIF